MTAYPILILCSDTVGARMAGPAIRYVKIAQELSRRWPCTLAVPSIVEGDSFSSPCKLVRLSDHAFNEILSNARIIITQGYNFPLHLFCKTRASVILDLYDPLLFEIAARDDAAHPAAEQFMLYEWTRRKMNILLSLASHFFCATERQRALWVGYLSALGALSPNTIHHDPALEDLFSLIPFGIEDDDIPQAKYSILRQKFPQITDNDIVFLWGGGLWDWLDPMLVLNAAVSLGECEPRAKFVFLAGKHPNPDIPRMKVRRKVFTEAERLGVLNRNVFLIDEWVPYEQRYLYLAGSDVGISFHKQTLEAEFSFRTRILDYLWAGLPCVVSGGDGLSSLIEKNNVGFVIPPGNKDHLIEKIMLLCNSPQLLEAFSTHSEKLRERFRWKTVLTPLVSCVERLLEEPCESAPLGLQTLLPFYARNIFDEFRYLGFFRGLNKLMARFGL